MGETGFGTGLNFLSCAKKFLDYTDSGALHFYSCEKFPLPSSEIRRIGEKFPALRSLADELADALPHVYRGFHTLYLRRPRIRLTLMYMDALEAFSSLEAGIDAWFLDGFSPDRNPEMWTGELFRTLASLSLPGATLATYTSAGFVRRGLEEAGFEMAKAKGYGTKREMLLGRVKTGVGRKSSGKREGPCAVIGGGFAGTAVARSLAERGLDVTLMEAGSLASGGSGNPAGIFFPQITARRDPMSQFSLSSYEYLLGLLKTRPQLPGERKGVLQLYADEHWQKRLEGGIADLPAELVRSISAREASEIVGQKINAPGIFFPEAGWSVPGEICASNADHPRIQLKSFTRVGSIEKNNDNFLILDSDGKELGVFHSVIICAGPSASAFKMTSWLPLKRVRGQIALVDLKFVRTPPPVVVVYEGYVIPAHRGSLVVGSTYHPANSDTDIDPVMNAELVSRLRESLPECLGDEFVTSSGRVSFRSASKDHMPIIGELYESAQPGAGVVEGMYVSGGHASRGLLSCHLGAEIIASEICGEGMPIERELLASISPARFSIRAEKKAGGKKRRIRASESD